MVDIFTPEKRSEIMSRIRSSGTRAEVRLYEIVRSVSAEILGPRKRIYPNAPHILGTPDVYVPSVRLAFFLDGCFFHGCPIHGHIPHSNSKYWEQKIKRNKRRDKRYSRKLREDGFSVWRFWEHELKPSSLPQTVRRLERAFEKQRQREGWS